MCKRHPAFKKIHPMTFFLKVFINKTLCLLYVIAESSNPIRPQGFSCKAHMQTPLCGQGRYTDQ